MIRVLIVDDRFLTRQAVQAILKQDTNIMVIGEADCGKKALEIVAEETADIAIVDLDMPGMSGFELTQQICQNYPKIKVIILSSHEDPESINQAIQCGARGYLIKDTSITELVDTIDRVQRGYFQLGPGLFEKLISQANNYEVETSKYISNLEIKSQQEFIIFQQEVIELNQQVRQDLFNELEQKVEQLKLEWQKGLRDFESRATLHIKDSLENRMEYWRSSQYDTQERDSRDREIMNHLNLIDSNYKTLFNKLKQEVTILRYSLIFMLFFLLFGSLRILF